MTLQGLRQTVVKKLAKTPTISSKRIMKSVPKPFTPPLQTSMTPEIKSMFNLKQKIIQKRAERKAWLALSEEGDQVILVQGGVHSNCG